MGEGITGEWSSAIETPEKTVVTTLVEGDGEKVAEGRIGRTNAFIFSADETADVGVDEATPVTEDYKERDNKFTGKVRKVTIDLK